LSRYHEVKRTLHINKVTRAAKHVGLAFAIVGWVADFYGGICEGESTSEAAIHATGRSVFSLGGMG